MTPVTLAHSYSPPPPSLPPSPSLSLLHVYIYIYTLDITHFDKISILYLDRTCTGTDNCGWPTLLWKKKDQRQFKAEI